MKTKEKSLIPSAAESSVLQRRHDGADDDTHRFAPTLLGLFSESRTQGTLQEGQQHRRQVLSNTNNNNSNFWFVSIWGITHRSIQSLLVDLNR